MFGYYSQGGEITVADVDGNGKLDLIVFHIRRWKQRLLIGLEWNLDVNGVVTGKSG